MENYWILRACCLPACYLVLCFCWVLQKVLSGFKMEKIARWSISPYEIALGDSVSFGLCSDLFTIKPDYQANTRSCLHLYDRFWTCVVRSYEMSFLLNLCPVMIITSTSVKYLGKIPFFFSYIVFQITYVLSFYYIS